MPRGKDELQKYFYFFYDWESLFYRVKDDSERGKLILAIMEFASGDYTIDDIDYLADLHSLSDGATMALFTIAGTIMRGDIKNAITQTKRRINGNKGGRKPSGYEENQEDYDDSRQAQAEQASEIFQDLLSQYGEEAMALAVEFVGFRGPAQINDLIACLVRGSYKTDSMNCKEATGYTD